MTLGEVVAASFLPEMRIWAKELPILAVWTSSATVGSRLSDTNLGKCFPAPVSETEMLKASSNAALGRSAVAVS